MNVEVLAINVKFAAAAIWIFYLSLYSSISRSSNISPVPAQRDFLLLQGRQRFLP